MDPARYAVEAVVLEGRSYRSVASSIDMSKSWVAKQVHRYRTGGYDALGKQSTAPRHRPTKVSLEREDEIISWRKRLEDEGLDAGPTTIRYHLEQMGAGALSLSTIYRILRRRGYVTPQPHKRPRTSWQRFEATLPNECWQADMTHWALADDTDVEIIDFIDDYSRMVICAVAVPVTTSADVVAAFYRATTMYGFPASVLTDNGAIFTAQFRGGRCGFESELATLGITIKHGKPYHPQTQGKIERFHRTLKLWLHQRPRADSIEVLQGQLDTFVHYYNEVRPHRARDMVPPRRAYDALVKASPDPAHHVAPHTRVRHDKIDPHGRFTLRYGSQMHHIGVGRAHAGRHILALVAGLDIRVISEEGELLRHLTLDPTKDYQPLTSGPAG